MDAETVFTKLDELDLSREETRYFNQLQVSYVLGNVNDEEVVADVNDLFADKVLFANTAVRDMENAHV